MGPLIVAVLFAVVNAQPYEGAPIHLATCNASSSAQHWTVVGQALKFTADKYCLDCNGCLANVMGYLWECDANNTNQQFTFQSDGTIRHAKPDTCVATYGTGNLIRMLLCNTSDPRQLWNVTTEGFVRSRATGRCMDITNQYYNPYPCTGSGLPNGYACGCLPGQVSNKLPFCDSTLPIDQRVADLVGRLNATEKQSMLGADVIHTDVNACAMMDSGVPRLGIPPYMNLVETNSAVAAVCLGDGLCATEFPSPALLAASFNRTAWHTKGIYLSDEMRAFSNLHMYRGCCGPHSFIGQTGFGPNINIVRDPRFGRNSELPSEDPFLAGTYAANYVRGMQFGPDPKYVKMIAGLKHFTAYSVENGREKRIFNISLFDLFDTYLAQYALGFAQDKGGALATMCSYAGVNQVPMCANDFLLNKVIRGKFNRSDVIVATDCGAINNMFEYNKYASTPYEAAAASINGGADLDLGDSYFGAESSGGNIALQEALDVGITQQQTIDDALTRVLTARFRVGQFDPVSQQQYTQLGQEVINSSTHWDFVLDTALQGLVLLRNQDNTLPFKLGGRLAVVGPHIYSQRDLFEDYVGDRVCNDATWNCVPTIADVFLQLHGSVNTTVAKGVDLDSTDGSGIAAALDAVTKADYVVLAIGLGNTQEHEGIDRTTTVLPGLQESFAQQVLAIGKPTVLVLINGGALAIDDIDGPAVIEAFYPAMRTGEALFKAIFGQANRWGRLPITLYHSDYIHQVDMYNFDMTSPPGRTYRYFTGEPQWPFGFGLSYTTFSVSCQLTDAVVCQLSNTGNVDGDAVIMVYHMISDQLRQRLTHPAPISSLVEFGRYSVKRSQTIQISFPVINSMLTLTNIIGDQVLYPGIHTLKVTDGVSTPSYVSITLDGPERILETAL